MTPKEFAKKIIQSINPGTADISDIGDGTIKGAICEQNKKIDNVFSTDEVKTNDIWIDGKPIYRKVFSVSSLPNATTISVAHGISGLSAVVRLYGIATLSGENKNLPLPYSDPDGANYNVALIANTSNIQIYSKANRSSLSGKIVIEYTK